MAGKRRKKIREPEITGLKYFKKLLPLPERLHDDGCARDKAGNRRLHFDHGIKIQTYCAIIACMLISLWTGRKPTLRTYEMIEEAKGDRHGGLSYGRQPEGCPTL